MEDNLFEIRLGIDRSQAQQANAEAVAEFREVEQAAKRSAQGQEDALKAVAQAHKPVQDDLKKETDLIRRQADEARKAANEEVRDLAKVDQAIRDTQRSTVAMTAATTSHGNASASAFALWQKGLDMALDTLRAFPSAFDKAADARKRYTQGFVDIREELRELATIEGAKANKDYTLGIIKESRDVGMREAAYVDFRKALQGAGQQYVGTNISKEEQGQFIHQAAELAAARKLSPETAGNLAGALEGFKNYQKEFGTGASEALSGDFNTLLAITGAGTGTDKENADQMGKILAGMANVDELKGAFTNPVDVAIAESTMAESDPGRAFTGLTAARRALQGANPASKEILEKAHITPLTPILQGVEQLAPVALAEAKRLHVSVDKVLRDNFKDEEAVAALSVLINKGVYSGVFAQRRKVAAQNQGFGPVQAQVEDFQGSRAYQEIFADVNKELAEAKRGAKSEDLEIVNKLAFARLTDKGVLNSSPDNIRKALASNFTGGFLSDQDRRQLVAERHLMEKEQRERLHLAPAAAPDAETLLGTFGAVGRSMFKMAGVDLAVPEMTAASEKANFRQIQMKLGIDPIAEMVAHEGIKIGRGPGNGNGNGGDAVVGELKGLRADLKAGRQKPKPMILRQPVPGGGRPQVNR